jgi:hypothetical protein
MSSASQVSQNAHFTTTKTTFSQGRDEARATSGVDGVVNKLRHAGRQTTDTDLPFNDILRTLWSEFGIFKSLLVEVEKEGK